MPIPVTPKPTYPNVPQAPGVPSVLRRVGQVQNNVVLLAGDVVGILNLFTGPQWGLFTSTGAPAFGSVSGTILGTLGRLAGLGGQSVGEVDFRNGYRISTAPQEQGAFMSYNKVNDPFQGRVTYIVSGLQGQRSAFLSAVSAAIASLDLYSLVMPEHTYPSCNITHYDLRRSAQNGITMFGVDIWVEEVRIAGSPQFSNTASASGADPVNGGTVQPQTPSQAQNPNVAGQESVAGAGGFT
jgi:hypothetical protein